MGHNELGDKLSKQSSFEGWSGDHDVWKVHQELLQIRQSGKGVSQSLKHVKIHFIVYAGAENTRNVRIVSERYGYGF